jgi:hypothetical protein
MHSFFINLEWCFKIGLSEQRDYCAGYNVHAYR